MLLLKCVLLFLVAIAHARPGTKNHSLSTLEKRQSNQTRDTLDRIIRTYEWQQYKFQGISCRNTPTLDTVCSEFTYGNAIPNLDSVFPYNNQYGGYNYLYTFVNFYGFSSANYTTIEPKIINVTAQAMYYFCQVNSTCATAWKATPNITTSLLNYVTQSSGQIKDKLTANSPQTWIPDSTYANGLSYLTAFPPADAELLGIQQSVLLASPNYNMTQLQGMYAAQLYWSGGAEMFESMINTVALLGLNTQSNSTTYVRRQTPQVGLPNPNSLLPPVPNVIGGNATLTSVRNQRDITLQIVSKLRGKARLNALLSLNSTSVYKALGLKSNPVYTNASQPALRRRAACSRTPKTIFYQAEASNYASDACKLVNVAPSFFSLPSTSSSLANSPYTNAASVLSSKTSYYFNDVLAVASFANALCITQKGDLPCYPTTNVWSTSGKPGYGVGVIFDTFGVTALVNSNTKVSTAQASQFNLECSIDSVVQQTYSNAVSCCKQNCNYPACIAGYMGSIGAGPGC